MRDNLSAYWRLEEASGSRADSHANAQTLTDNNTVTSTTGLVDTCAVFNAANSEYLSAADSATLSLGGLDFTISLWFYASTLPSSGNFMRLLSKWNTTGDQREYALDIYNDGSTTYPRFLVSDSGADPDNEFTGTITLADSSPVSTGTWYHLLAAHQQAFSGNQTLRVNNGDTYVPINGDTIPQSNCFDGTAQFRLGADNQGNYFDGRLDEVAIWKRLLNDGERNDLYNSGNGLGWPLRNGPISMGRSRGLR